MINIRLTLPTIEKINKLQKSLSTLNRTQTIVTAVNLASEIAESIKNKGAKVYVEQRDGSKERLVLY